MSGLAIVMAGGSGCRMSASGGTQPKPLMQVGGSTLLEHNLNQLARHGFSRVVIAVSAREPAILAFAQRHLRRSAVRLGVDIEILIEPTPLGNIGAVRLLHSREEHVLTVFADNLTGLDLRALFERHRSSDAAMTTATHSHPFRMPFGEVKIHQGLVTGYLEKPTYAFAVCSAVCALSPRAIGAIKPAERLGLSDLVNRLIAMGEPVQAYEHDAPWIDVNDTPAIAKAEALLRAHPALFGRQNGLKVPV